ncbi:hypothetical protein IHE45_17G008600 [Dioscorea alata]|uniref:Uncharacterized protein n=1 Tax=Dioscorea alata TaxID=55571 RepID=A0ACB7UAA6_DIOAL|nr:hypothetical protein IHE45_17G008600 [Dioscorea alata]
MLSTDLESLAGAEIHGFHNTADLDVERLMEEATSRCFRPNEVHALFSNYTRFKLRPKNVELPPSFLIGKCCETSEKMAITGRRRMERLFKKHMRN